MTQLVIGDNAWGTLAGAILVGDLSINLTAGHGARFPTLAAGQAFFFTFANASNQLERVLCTIHAAASDILGGLTRGMGGDTPIAYLGGDRVEMRPNSLVMSYFAQLDSCVLVGTPTCPTPGVGDNSQKIANTLYVNSVAMAAALPGQANQNGNIVQSIAGAAGWKANAGSRIFDYQNFV